MSMDGVVPPQSGPSRRPAGGPTNHPGAQSPQEPGARRYGAQGNTAQDSVFPEHGTPDSGAHAAGRPRFENVVGGAESGGSLGSSTPPAWHGPAGPGDVPGDPAPAGAGPADPSAGGAPISAAEANLADALRASVSGVGLTGPPPGGIVHIRRKARARQRNRVVLAGSAGILMLAAAVTMATGAHFDLVPTLTGASGTSGGSAPDGQSGTGGSAHPSAAGNGGQVVWPTGSPGKTGLAIGPVAPVVATPSEVAAGQLPLCTSTSLKTDTTMGPTVSGVAYGRVDAVAQSSCVAVGPPVLTVANQAGTASSSIMILKENAAAAPQLPSVPTWGETMVLKAGQGYQFQFAWAATTCPQGSASPTPSPTSAPSVTSMYYLGYDIIGTTPAPMVTLDAPCGAQVYVTDIYNAGTFPLPKASVQPPPVVSSSAAPPPSSPAPPPPPPPSTPPPATTPPASPSPSPSDSSSPSTGGVASSQATTPSG